MELQRLSKSKVSLYASLSRKKFRDKEGLFIVEGAKCVADILQSGLELVTFIALQSWIDENGIPEGVSPAHIAVATSTDLRKISTLISVPPVMATFRLPGNKDVPAPVRGNLYLVLDGVQDPGNLGTIVRSADWFGVHTIYASRDTVDIFNPKALMATMGSLARVSIFYTDIIALLRSTPDFPVYGTLLEGNDIYDARLGGNGFIVMGNEGRGLSPDVRELVTSPLLIPPGNPDSHSESLNVGVATAVVLAEFARRKRM